MNSLEPPSRDYPKHSDTEVSTPLALILGGIFTSCKACNEVGGRGVVWG
jgi:hypothetical protein